MVKTNREIRIGWSLNLQGGQLGTRCILIRAYTPRTDLQNTVNMTIGPDRIQSTTSQTLHLPGRWAAETDSNVALR